MIKIVRANLTTQKHADALIQLMDVYAFDPAGGGTGLNQFAKDNLSHTLANRPGVFVLLAYVIENPIGLLTCMEGFSTFHCKPLLNIHDAVVKPDYRGQGVATLLLQEAENIARETNCCKLTLEVLEGNIAARTVYSRFGFKEYQLDPKMGNALFWEKCL